MYVFYRYFIEETSLDDLIGHVSEEYRMRVPSIASLDRSVHSGSNESVQEPPKSSIP
jgi:hypothetical protein